MKKIVDAIFETDETQDVALRIVNRDERATLRQVRSYWSDDTTPRLSGVSETDIATLPSEELRKRVADFWGEEFVVRADRLTQGVNPEPVKKLSSQTCSGGSSILQKVMAIAACLMAVVVLGSLIAGREPADVAEVVPANSEVANDDTASELRSIQEPLVAGIGPLVRSSALPPYLNDLQLQDGAVLSSRTSPGETAWVIDLVVSSERFQIVSVTLGGEFDNPYKALEALGYDGNVRDALSSRLAAADDVNPRNLQIGDRFLAVLQSTSSNAAPRFLSLSYFPKRQTVSLAGQVPTCGTGSLNFSELGLIRAAVERHANVTTRAVNNCASALELAVSNAVLRQRE